MLIGKKRKRSDAFGGEPEGNLDVVIAAVRENGLALQCALQELKSNREIVMEAVKQFGLTLEYASDELKGDREIDMKADK